MSVPDESPNDSTAGSTAADPVREILGVAVGIDLFDHARLYCLVRESSGSGLSHSVYVISGGVLIRRPVTDILSTDDGSQVFMINDSGNPGFLLENGSNLLPWNPREEVRWIADVSHDCVVLNSDDVGPAIELALSPPVPCSDAYWLLEVTGELLDDLGSAGTTERARTALARLTPEEVYEGDSTCVLPLWLVREFGRLLSPESLGVSDSGRYVRSRKGTEQLYLTLVSLRIVALAWLNKSRH